MATEVVNSLGPLDYTLNNPDTLTKYKTAGQISQKVLEEVKGWCTEGANIVELCERGDKLLADEITKVYKGKKITKGIGHPVTISPSSYVTPYTPLKSEVEEAATTLKANECIKIQLGAQIDGFCTIVCDSIIVGAKDGEVSGREADLMLANYYANELLLRLMLPPGLVASGTEEEQKKAAAQKQYSQSKITQMLEKVVKSFNCNLVESTTIWMFERNEIEAKKKIILAPGDGVKGEGLPEVGEVWGVEMGVSLGSGKIKTLPNRATLHRRTAIKSSMRRDSSRKFLTEAVNKFGTFPFSLRQFEDEKMAKVGVHECVSGGVVRQYEVVGDKSGEPVARLFTTVAITKNGITRLAAPPTPDLSKFKTENKITDEEILKILEQPIGKTSVKKQNKKKKKKPAKKAEAEGEEEESDDEEGVVTALAMPNLRPKRNSKSRTSTPLPFTANDSPASASPSDPRKEKSQSFLDGWVEPPVKKPTPSFEDYGFARHGVVEGMQPLGLPPPPKLKIKMRVSGGTSTPQSHSGHTGNLLAGDGAVSTPEMTPARDLEREPSEEHEEEDLMPIPAARDGDDEDDEYVPVPRKSSIRSNKTPMKNGVAKVTTPKVTTANVITPVQPIVQSAPVMQDFTERATRQRLHIVVNESIQRANVSGRPNVGLAIRAMHEDSKTNPYVAAILHNIIHQKATPEQLHEFAMFQKRVRKDIRKKQKRAMRRESASQAHETPAKTPSSFTPARTNSSTEVITETTPTASTATQQTSTRAAAAENNNRLPYPLGPLGSPTVYNKIILDSIGSPELLKMRSPRKRKAPDEAPVTRSPPKPVSVPPPQHVQAPSPLDDGSDSDLSDVNEEIVQNGPPEALPATSDVSTSEAGKKKSVKSAKKKKVHNGKKSRHSTKPTGQLKEMKDLNGWRDSEDDAAYQAKKQAMRRTFEDIDVPVSSVRFDNDTDSDWDLNQRVGPLHNLDAIKIPYDQTFPRRNGHPSQNGASSSNFASPQVDSAATTRPSTPAALPPHAKRLKLVHGQSQTARTKKSPVKSRTQGPVAGIPRTGGGMRTLGPDDNDPASPPTDNDDFCSACNGPGVFLCCDGCPRAFHFLCCDPPLHEDQVPAEAYYCHSCRTKLKRSEEESASTSYLVLGPLFKNLESSNVRAFEPPKDIQTYFEGVETKKDGSYGDVTKKFPLSKSSGYGAQRPDYLKLLDNQQKPVLCVQCGEGSRGKRPMLQCDYCHTNWHTDCCDPPLAGPPYIGPESTHREAWRCPRHIEHDFRSGTLVQHDLNPHPDDSDVEEVPAIPRKVRKPKNPTVYEPVFTRGQRNNGLIEVINDPGYDTDGQGNYLTSFLARESLDENTDQNGKVFRIPEKGIILDFVDKVKSSRIQKEKSRKIDERAARKVQEARKASIAAWQQSRPQDRQTALFLTQLAHKEGEVGMHENTIEGLVLGLTAEAPKGVIDSMSAAAPAPLTEERKAELMKIRVLIDQALGEGGQIVE
ncbi:hypothetical protein GQ43DRAFT_447690 [Delitschia confertaspora ATCC 74209]|uniref:PHD-type domain-containing protein n=1 Tax=Delitschia confertaspora ATCC 74209 TaxID=1513339 RepID=A0A9P4MXC2_9PLEO|nr:hypothetical protein GQ43DRAFT_447690 [Delitschia confertaspora ATCC 74209]